MIGCSGKAAIKEKPPASSLFIFATIASPGGVFFLFARFIYGGDVYARALYTHEGTSRKCCFQSDDDGIEGVSFSNRVGYALGLSIFWKRGVVGYSVYDAARF